MAHNTSSAPAAPAFQGRAMSASATRRALTAYAARAIVLIVAARAELALAKWLEQPAPGEQPSGWLAVAGFFALCFGVLWLLNAARMWWWLRRHPWVQWNCLAREIRRSAFDRRVAQLLLSNDAGAEHVMSAICTRWRWPALRACDDSVVWMAGHPDRGGVVAVPGGIHLVWVRRTTPAALRERLRRQLRDSQSLNDARHSGHL
jgi:hypothetical protein